MSGSSNDFDLPSLLSTDFGDFTVRSLPLLVLPRNANSTQPMDLGGWFDSLDAGGTSLWDSDLFSTLPSLP